MRAFLCFVVVLAACRSPGVDGSRADDVATRPPSPTPTVDDATWASWAAPCTNDEQCTAVAGCCACGARDYRAVLTVHEAEAAKSIVRGNCDCPQQKCNLIHFVCRAGKCAVEEH